MLQHQSLKAPLVDSKENLSRLRSKQLVRRRINETQYRKGIKAGLSELQSRIIAARDIGCQELRRFVAPRASDLDPFQLLADVELAANRIATAIANEEVIACFSDYDADGLGANACFRHVMKHCFGYPSERTLSFVGDRLKEGYGLTNKAVERILSTRTVPSVVITADCGSADEDRIHTLAQNHISVVVTDHHHIPVKTPDSAYAFVNPQRPDCRYPDKAIAGGMVLWLLMWAVRQEMKRLSIPVADPSALVSALDFVTCSTVADCVSLASVNNRVIVREGLRQMNESPRPCWRAMGQFIHSESITESTIGFDIASRINARTRLDEPMAALDFLTAEDEALALKHAKLLDEENTKRKEIEKRIKEDVIKQAIPAATSRDCALAVFLRDGHAGVQGISASRVLEAFGLPTFIFSPSKEAGLLTGSGRSVEGFDLKSALDEIASRSPGVLVHYGGHAAAAGATINEDRFSDFAETFEQIARERIDESLLGPRLISDGELDLSQLTQSTIAEIRGLAPYGRGFESPVFDGEFEVISAKPVGDGTHLRMTLRAKDRVFPAIWFRAVNIHGEPLQLAAGAIVRLVYEPTENHFRGQTTLQLMVRGQV